MNFTYKSLSSIENLFLLRANMLIIVRKVKKIESLEGKPFLTTKECDT